MLFQYQAGPRSSKFEISSRRNGALCPYCGGSGMMGVRACSVWLRSTTRTEPLCRACARVFSMSMLLVLASGGVAGSSLPGLRMPRGSSAALMAAWRPTRPGCGYGRGRRASWRRCRVRPTLSRDARARCRRPWPRRHRPARPGRCPVRLAPARSGAGCRRPGGRRPALCWRARPGAAPRRSCAARPMSAIAKLTSNATRSGSSIGNSAVASRTRQNAVASDVDCAMAAFSITPASSMAPMNCSNAAWWPALSAPSDSSST